MASSVWCVVLPIRCPMVEDVTFVIFPLESFLARVVAAFYTNERKHNMIRERRCFCFLDRSKVAVNCLRNLTATFSLIRLRHITDPNAHRSTLPKITQTQCTTTKDLLARRQGHINFPAPAPRRRLNHHISRGARDVRRHRPHGKNWHKIGLSRFCYRKGERYCAPGTQRARPSLAFGTISGAGKTCGAERTLETRRRSGVARDYGPANAPFREDVAAKGQRIRCRCDDARELARRKPR